MAVKIEVIDSIADSTNLVQMIRSKNDSGYKLLRSQGIEDEGENENAVVFDAKEYAGDNLIVEKGKTPTLEGFIDVNLGYVQKIEEL